jgi:hypothetical protein
MIENWLYVLIQIPTSNKSKVKMVGKIECCLVINFYTYHVDTNKDSKKKKKNKEGYVFPQKNQFYYSSQLHFFF